MKGWLLVAVACLGPAQVVAAGSTQLAAEELAKPRQARDQGDVQALRGLIAKAQQQASQQSSFDAYLRLAQLEDWMYEAAQGHNDKKLVKESAQGGIAAAEKAVKLNANSSEAHCLLGHLLSELIPYVFAGGPRLGPRSTAEIEKAIELDPRNAEAYVDRGANYFFTPTMFGGNKEKAIEMLKKAIELDPTSDTAHLWLASVYQATGRHDEALREIDAALRLNPDRGFTRHLRAQIAPGHESVY
jgi:tetratricopeptide (TPR) repeat protein